MTSPILVTGGTGTLGRLVVPRLTAVGHYVRVLSRHHHEPGDLVEHVVADLVEDEGLADAVDGAEVVLHLAGGTKGDEEGTRNLLRAASKVGVRHVVYISVIGADTVPLGWFRSKLGAERAVAGSGLPWTTLRAAQFHDLVLITAQKMAKLPVVPSPGGLRFEPVDADEVAARLVELTLGGPSGRVADLAGPKVYPLADLVRSYLAAVGKRRFFLPVRVPGGAGRAYRAGANLSREGAAVGARTWEEFLAEHLRPVQPRTSTQAS